jgi:hypothetical protein
MLGLNGGWFGSTWLLGEIWHPGGMPLCSLRNESDGHFKIRCLSHLPASGRGFRCKSATAHEVAHQGAARSQERMKGAKLIHQELTGTLGNGACRPSQIKIWL